MTYGPRGAEWAGEALKRLHTTLGPRDTERELVLYAPRTPARRHSSSIP